MKEEGKMVEENVPDWPYPVRYGEETEVSADVLVLGGGVAGSFAAIAAAKKGSKVILVDKGPIKTSGSGGAGVDHWNFPCTAPFCKISPKQMTDAIQELSGGWANPITIYIECMESYDALLDVEKWGVKIRDIDDEFEGAEFRDEKTKLMFAYDYTNK